MVPNAALAAPRTATAAPDRPSRLAEVEFAVLMLASCAPAALFVLRGLGALLAG